MEVFNRRNVILITDGDNCAIRAIEKAVQNIGGRCISRTGGNPTPIDSIEIVKLIKDAKNDPVIVMVDDKGNTEIGKGEQALIEIVNHPDINVMGIIAVASNTKGVLGAHVDFSIDSDGKIIKRPVDKNGAETNNKVLYGDTVDIIGRCNVPVVIGIGDIGKMEGKDDIEIGAPIVTKALEEILIANRAFSKK